MRYVKPLFSVESKGSTIRTERFLRKNKNLPIIRYLEEAGRRGVELLAQDTPKDTGLTAASWTYTIVKTKTGYALHFQNTNSTNGIPVVILIQYGHATRNGGWVEPNDFINPITKRLMDELANKTWQEVTNA